MPDPEEFSKLIAARLEELGARSHDIDHELGEPKTADLNDQAIDLEDDEVLESLGAAAQKEISLLRLAQARIANGTYGICSKCGDPISDARLRAVLYAALCKECVAAH
jgi:RNA polymerase-binding transcription factor DksA